MEQTKRKGEKPYKANGVIEDPRQSLFFSYYVNPKSETFGNAYRSAIKATYSEDYAKIITSQLPDWLSEKLRKHKTEKMATKARRNLDEFLDLETIQDVYNKDGEVVGRRRDSGLTRVKADVTKFVAEKLDDDFKGKNENHININVNINEEEKNKIDKVLNKLFKEDAIDI